ncbi:hypothetical protein A2U01_0005137 [Trifolium medium]|uniref:Uncharacterized protein n=1 Tax=Trifolium medium TaxID=97028 RepID=A0A392MA37_9FABA|nr:hypothetical protein [Trifolium medium]
MKSEIACKGRKKVYFGWKVWKFCPKLRRLRLGRQSEEGNKKNYLEISPGAKSFVPEAKNSNYGVRNFLEVSPGVKLVVPGAKACTLFFISGNRGFAWGEKVVPRAKGTHSEADTSNKWFRLGRNVKRLGRKWQFCAMFWKSIKGELCKWKRVRKNCARLSTITIAKASSSPSITFEARLHPLLILHHDFIFFRSCKFHYHV